MTVLQKLLVKQSETREAINKLLSLETRTEEQDGELVKLTHAFWLFRVYPRTRGDSASSCSAAVIRLLRDSIEK